MQDTHRATPPHRPPQRLVMTLERQEPGGPSGARRGPAALHPRHHGESPARPSRDQFLERQLPADGGLPSAPPLQTPRLTGTGAAMQRAKALPT